MRMLTALSLMVAGVGVAALAAHSAKKREAQRAAPTPSSDEWLESLGMQVFKSSANTGGPVGLFMPSGFDKTKPFTVLLVLHDTEKENGVEDLLQAVEWKSRSSFRDENGRTRPARNAVVVLPRRGTRAPRAWMLPPDNARLLVEDTSLVLLNDDFVLPTILTTLGPGGSTAGHNALQSGFVPDAVQYLEAKDAGLA